MRQLRLLSACAALVAPLAFAACSSKTAPGGSVDGATSTTDAGTLPIPEIGFQTVTPDIQITAGQEITYCYYFHTTNTEPVIVKNWQSVMTAGSHHLIVYFTSTAQMPDGTLDPSGECGGATGGGGGSDLPVWTYSAQSPTAEADMPADDGTGKPVGMLVPANQAAVVQLHYINATENTLTVHATINANGYPTGTAYTQAAAYVTYNDAINIPAGAVNAEFTGTCTVDPSYKFFTMSTHSHKQTVMDTVMDGSAMVLTTTDWSAPTIKTWETMPFYTFASGSLTYSCYYDNTSGSAIVSGQSAVKNEMCMAVGYFFPATAPQVCLTTTSGSFVISE